MVPNFPENVVFEIRLGLSNGLALTCVSNLKQFCAEYLTLAGIMK